MDENPSQIQPKISPSRPRWQESRWLTLWSERLRLIMLVPVAATFVAGIALIIFGSVETWHFVYDLFFAAHAVAPGEAVLEAIEILDLFLLVAVVEVVSFGLYQLHFNQHLPLPQWMKIDSLDELKSKLVTVTITVLAVSFLGEAAVATGGPDILYLGAASALVITALTYFLSQFEKRH
jgi:uncharacterized membrane protein YqhA